MAYTGGLDLDEYFMIAYRVFKLDFAVVERSSRVCIDKSFSDHNDSSRILPSRISPVSEGFPPT
jgi:hypothetical protein